MKGTTIMKDSYNRDADEVERYDITNMDMMWALFFCLLGIVIGGLGTMAVLH